MQGGSLSERKEDAERVINPTLLRSWPWLHSILDIVSALDQETATNLPTLSTPRIVYTKTPQGYDHRRPNPTRTHWLKLLAQVLQMQCTPQIANNVCVSV